MKQKLKTSSGITLIALVITIIIMLILVAVTVTISLNGGLFTTANESKKQTQIAAYRDAIDMIGSDLDIKYWAYGISEKDYIDQFEVKLLQEKDSASSIFKGSQVEKISDQNKIKLTTKEGYEFYITKEEKEIIEPEVETAWINENKNETYPNMQLAIEGANDGDIIKLQINEYSDRSTPIVNKRITVDINDKVLNKKTSTIQIASGGNMTLTGTGTIKTPKEIATITNYGTLNNVVNIHAGGYGIVNSGENAITTISEGTIESDTLNAIMNEGNGKVEILLGTIIGNTGSTIFNKWGTIIIGSKDNFNSDKKDQPQIINHNTELREIFPICAIKLFDTDDVDRTSTNVRKCYIYSGKITNKAQSAIQVDRYSELYIGGDNKGYLGTSGEFPLISHDNLDDKLGIGTACINITNGENSLVHIYSGKLESINKGRGIVASGGALQIGRSDIAPNNVPVIMGCNPKHSTISSNTDSNFTCTWNSGYIYGINGQYYKGKQPTVRSGYTMKTNDTEGYAYLEK